MSPQILCIGGFRGGRGPYPPLEHGPIKFQKRVCVPSGASRMLENLLAAGALRRTPLGDLSALHRPPSWWGGGWLPLPQEPNPALRPLETGGLAPPNMMGWIRLWFSVVVLLRAHYNGQT